MSSLQNNEAIIDVITDQIRDKYPYMKIDAVNPAVQRCLDMVVQAVEDELVLYAGFESAQ